MEVLSLSSNVLRIREFDPCTMCRPFKHTDTDGVKILVVGRPGSGKSHMIRSLLYSKRHIFPAGVAFSGTETATSYWSSIFPSTFVFPEIDVQQVETIVARQARYAKDMSNGWICMLFDDVADNKSALSTPIFRTIVKNGRHLKIFFVISVQYVTDLPPTIRHNVDFVMMFREPSVVARKKLFLEFGGVCGDFATFSAVMDSLTGDHTCMVIDNANQCNSIEETVFWHKAPAHVPKDFMLGCPDYWKYHYLRGL